MKILTTQRASHPKHSQVEELVRRKQLGNVEVEITHMQFKVAKVTGSNPVLTTTAPLARGS